MSKEKTAGKKKRQFKSPNAYVTLFLIVCVVAILTWFIPGGQYELNETGQAISGTYHPVESNPQGVWDVFMSPINGMLGIEGMSGAISISLFIMLFGSFLEMIEHSGALKVFLKRVSLKNQGNSHKLIAILMILMALMGNIEGAYEEGFVYLLMFLPIIIAMGMDTMVALAIVIVGTQIGCMSSIINPFATGIASEIAGISPGEGMLVRIILSVLATTIAIIFVCRYADQIQKDPKKSLQYHRREADQKEFALTENEDLSMSKQQKRVLWIFVALVTIMTVALIPWDALNEKWTFFITITEWLTSMPVIGTILGKSMVPFGQWYFNELSMLLIVLTVASGFSMGYKVDQTLNIIIKGASALVSTAFIVPLARGIQVIMNTGLITPTILNVGETALNGIPASLFSVIQFIFYLPITVLMPSSTGLAAATMSIMSSLSRFASLPEFITIIGYLMSLSLVKMIAPTSIVVMTCTQIAHVPYTNWVKFIWKFILLMFLFCCAFLFITTLITT